MVSFEFGKEIEKDVFRLVTSVGQRKSSDSPRGNEPQSSDAPPLSRIDFTVSNVHYEVRVTHVLHTARISNVDSFIFVIRIREMVSFELSKEIEKDVFRLVTSVTI